jgi:phosphoribosylglycinamide formyltransferase-1
MMRLGVLVSGSGSNLQAIIDACAGGVLRGAAAVAVVIANKEHAYGLERARLQHIPAIFADRQQFPDSAAYGAYLVSELHKHQVDIVCLAGFLLKIDPVVIRAFPGRILNIHPALLPLYGGKGMYGHHVHEAVVRARERESGATVHIVDEEYDHGPTVVQRRVPLTVQDDPAAVARKVLVVEHQVYPEAIRVLVDRLQQK